MHFLMHFLKNFPSVLGNCLLSLIDIFQGVRLNNERQQCDKSNEYIIRLIIDECSMELQILERTKYVQSNILFLWTRIICNWFFVIFFCWSGF